MGPHSNQHSCFRDLYNHIACKLPDQVIRERDTNPSPYRPCDSYCSCSILSPCSIPCPFRWLARNSSMEGSMSKGQPMVPLSKGQPMVPVIRRCRGSILCTGNRWEYPSHPSWRRSSLSSCQSLFRLCPRSCTWTCCSWLSTCVLVCFNVPVGKRWMKYTKRKMALCR